ncbi:hypothetical protein N7539_000789 [Penicillium diatomitis]|uniref:Fungal specific transcription factor n=1 Tax=Penicillium diatomitis TaxID=2819901 RepID=A0A9W9XMI8_9EURO|nr:uncharacterized protein N7539_000789 [Penicillium diatomitis]KAJ5495673.1 hypothetical protein N7539_000789 [Penicillium diatomitis]
MQLSRTAYRAALFPLSVNPLLARASLQHAACWSLSSNHGTYPAHPFASTLSSSSCSSRLYGVLFPQCIARPNANQPVFKPSSTPSNSNSTAKAMSTSTSPGSPSAASTQHSTQSTSAAQTDTNGNTSNQEKDGHEPEHAHDHKEQLYLPSTEDASSHSGNIRLDVSSESGVTLDHLGPMVVNVDGSLSRIGNWAQMAEIERRNTLRIIGKRNRERLARLKAEGVQVGGVEEREG